MDCKRKSPSVVARLMGLDDAIPAHPSVLTTKGNLQYAGSMHSHSGGRALHGCQQEQVGYFDRLKSGEVHSYCHEKKESAYAYGIRQLPSRSNFYNNQAPPKGVHNKYGNEKTLALDRDKFMEAKQLAVDEKLVESTEFHDALEILSSNRDSFLKVLEEPNCFYSKHLKELPSIPPPPHKYRITVLKPSKTIETKSEKQVKRHQDSGCKMQNSIRSPNFAHHPMTEKLSQPARIVVLKPTSRKHYDMKAPSTPASSPEPPEKGDCYGALEISGAIGRREVAMEIRRQMNKKLSKHQRHESLLCSVCSNGYAGDDCSCNMPENYEEELHDNISDSVNTNSWDYVSNRYDSPYSHSSLSQASSSSKSSVIREAKEQLSERWALVTSNGLYQEQLEKERSSSTLGEMLAIDELKREDGNDMAPSASGSRSCSREEHFRMPTACLSIGRTKDENGGEGSSGNLSRSKSVPNSSSNNEHICLNTEDSNSLTDKSMASKGMAKSRSGKTSFKGRVSSLFFFKNKKGCRDKSISSLLVISEDGLPIISDDTADKKHDDSSQAVLTNGPGESPPGYVETVCSRISSVGALRDNPVEMNNSPKATLSKEDSIPSSENPETLRTHGENQDHPSPTSMLDAPFKDYEIDSAPSSSKIVSANNPALSRSSPIETIGRTLSLGGSCSEASPPNTFKLSRVLSEAGEDDPEDLLFMQNLIAAAGLHKNTPSTTYDGWDSPKTLLDPKLLDKLLDQRKEAAKSRESRSNQRLLFDCVNAVLLDVDHGTELGAYQCAGACGAPHYDTPLAAEVWRLVWSMLSGAGEAENGSCMGDRLLSREVAGSRWSELVQLEMAAISKVIGVQVLDDMVGDVLVELTIN